ncbi:AAA family ATPase [Bosea sp. NPDC055594]
MTETAPDLPHLIFGGDETPEQREAIFADYVATSLAIIHDQRAELESEAEALEAITPEERELLDAKRCHRPDIAAKIFGLRNTIELPATTPKPANDNQRSTAIDGESLLAMEFEPVRYVVPGYIAEGLTLLGGRPKLGKSWLALDFGIAVASGGMSLGVRCQQGDAIYFALEDNQRRLRDRLRVVLPRSDRPDISRLTLETEAPKVNAGLVERLDAWRTAAADPRLAIVDTFAMVRPARGRQQDSYAADYEALSPLQRWASEHNIALVVVTHVRKMEADDPLEMISGTNGLTGAADSILVLNRTSDGPKLYGRGRDIEEIEKALRFDAGRWSVIGDAADAKRSDERRAVMDAMAAGHQSPGEIAKAIGKPVANVQYLLGKMVAAGEAEKSKYGLYTPPSESSDPSE